MRAAVWFVFALAFAAIQGVAWAQAPPSTAPVTPSTPGSASPAADGGSFALTAGLLVGLVVLVGLVGKLLDLRKKREAEAVHVQAQISDALLREARLFRLPLTPTARVPYWHGSPVTVELLGQVPDEETRATVLRIARQEGLRIRPDVEIADRLVVDAPPVTRAA